MKAMILGVILSVMMTFLAVAGFIFKGSFFLHQWWFWLAAMLVMVAVCLGLIFMLLRKDYDDNPYYADMVRAKRAEVHAMQKMVKDNI